MRLRFASPVRLVSWYLAGAAAFVGAAAQAQTGPFAWQTSSPEEQGVDSAQLARMCAQLQREHVALDGFVLVRHDRILAEAYVYPYAATSRHAMYSVSKSFTSSLVGIAIDRGFFSGVEERVADIFANVTTQPLAERMGRMTLRHLLTMASGHANDTTARITATLNWERAFMELPVEEEPGTRFVYNSGGSYMLAAAVQRRVGTSTANFAQQYLFGPLGIVDYTWDTSPQGVVCGGWGLSLRPRDMARFGLMYLHGGRWEGRQVVPASWVEAASHRQMNNGTAGFWGSGYGYQFWINDFGGFRADGAFAQYIFVLPEHDLVVVFTNNLTSDTELPARMVRQYILPTLSAEPLPANPRAEALLARVADAVGAQPGTAVAPTFLQLPQDLTVAAGETATLSVTATGTPTPTCQWYKDEVELANATDTTLRLATARAEDGGDYVAVLRNSIGATATFPVRLTVVSPPTILREPQSIVVGEGGEATFVVGATGGSLSYQWRRDGAAIAGATGDSLRLPTTTRADAGEYTVVVTSPRGSVVSAPARLSVGTPDRSARLVNLSVRAAAGSGSGTLTVGLVVGGGDPANGAPVLLRGVGPSLASLGVSGVLADPALVLRRFRAMGTLATNADWRGAPLLAQMMDLVGATPIPRRSADAAIATVLPPGAYTVQVVSSVPDRSGVALAECYDAASVATADAPRLLNVSARARAGGGDETLEVGFVITGSGTKRILLRGVGPTLTGQGVDGALADPELRLFSRGTAIAFNDDWAGATELRDAFARSGALELPADSRDAALVIDLPAGIYSAHVSGKAGATGIALVEVYAVP
jgi:CubicO group peptidase (beta-lactamase class C family)